MILSCKEIPSRTDGAIAEVCPGATPSYLQHHREDFLSGDPHLVTETACNPCPQILHVLRFGYTFGQRVYSGNIVISRYY